MRTIISVLAGFIVVPMAFGQETSPKQAPKPSANPLPVPLTRPEMKQLLEDLKMRTPRIPLPEMTEAEKEKLSARGQGYEGRVRFHYMPKGEGGSGGFGKNADPKMSLTYEFKTRLFWIVSRTNNCQY